MIKEVDLGAVKVRGDKKFGRIGLYAGGVCLVVLLVIVLITLLKKDDEQVTTIITQPAINSGAEERNLNNFKNLINNNFPYSATADNFKIVFPAKPTKSSDSTYSEALVGNIKMTTYYSQYEDVSYAVITYDYDSPNISESNPDFDVQGALEGAINGMVNSCSSGEIIAQTATKIGDKDAFDVTVSCDGEYFQGFVVFNDVKLYLVMVDYTEINRPDANKIESYLESFGFLQ